MELKKLREQIDNYDVEIIHLLAKRIEASVLSKKLKKQIEDKQRETEIFTRLKDNYSPLVDSQLLKKLFTLIIEHGKTLQNKGLDLIAFQGEHGAYSEVAANLWDKDFLTISCKTFMDVFDKVKLGFCDYGIVPMENSLGGVIGEVNHMLLDNDMFIVGAVDLHIQHCLLATKQTNYREIKQVYSHWQALSQCKKFIKRHNIKAIDYFDTAAAAKYITIKQEISSAAISSELSAKYYNLEIVKKGIEDIPSNITRFLIIAKKRVDSEDANKCSIVFSSATSDKAGSLFKILKVFADAGLSLTRLESFPRFDKPGHYAFFVDFIGSDHDKNVKVTLSTVNSITDSFKFLGCYKELIDKRN